MKTPRLLAVLVCLLILVPLVRGEDAIRHQDPDSLKAENPNWLNLYMFYDLAYNSIVAEKYEDIFGWLKYADEIYATSNLAEPLKGFSGLIENVSTDLNTTKNLIETARKYLQQINIVKASTTLDQALVSLRAANATVDRLDVTVKQIASTLKSSPDPLLKNNQNLRELIAKYFEMINNLRRDIKFYKIIYGEPVSPEDWDQFFKDHPELNPADFFKPFTKEDWDQFFKDHPELNPSDFIPLYSKDDWDQFFKDHPELNPSDYIKPVFKEDWDQFFKDHPELNPSDFIPPYSKDDWEQFFKDHPELNPADYGYPTSKIKRTHIILAVETTGDKRTVPVLDVNPPSVKVGETVKVFGFLIDNLGLGLSSKSISLYFDDYLVEKISTLEDGSFSVIMKVPYWYKPSLIVRAEYRPTVEDLYQYLPSFANVVLKLIYFTPTLDVSAPSFVYPGTVAEFTGYASYDNAPLPNLSIRFIGLGASNVAVTGVDGAFRATISVPKDYPANTVQVVVHAEPRGIYGPVEKIVNVKVVRIKSTVSASCDSWAFSGSSILVKGSVLAEGAPLSGCRVLVKGIFGEFTTETRVDGSYEVSCILPDSVFTGRSDFSVYASPVEPWIDSSQAEMNVFIVNVFSILAGVILVGSGAYSLSKRAKIKPKKQIVVAPTVNAANYEASIEVETVEVMEQKELKTQILGAIEYIRGITGIEFKPSATIREYLSNVKARLEDKTYELFSNLMFSYERWLYGRPAGYKKDVLTRILDYFNEIFENES